MQKSAHGTAARPAYVRNPPSRFGRKLRVGLPGWSDAGQGSRVTIESIPFATSAAAGLYVASRNGAKYYPQSCTSASRISEANKIWFASADDAQAAGYAPAANCAPEPEP